jgi:uncharacterized protein YecT (DUF1311 family)
MKTATSIIVLALLTLMGDQVIGQPPAKCPAGQTSFKGKCVSKGDCCEDVCPAGTVFEFRDKPACVPCAKAEMQMAINDCAIGELQAADAKLNAEYKKMMGEFSPELTKTLREAERAWVVFRDKLCEARAAAYEGGSIQPQMLTQCKTAETRRQVERLAEIRKEWATQ